MTLGERIKELRKNKKMTQRQLAEVAGIDFTYLSKIENDRLEHSPSLKALQRLAEVLEADELEFLNLADKMPPLLRDLAQNQEALQFFRNANKLAKPPGFWRHLSSRLDEIAKDAEETEKDKEP